ncbi:unnamed protein product, partial [Rotaria sp. Silwood2]
MLKVLSTSSTLHSSTTTTTTTNSGLNLAEKTQKGNHHRGHVQQLS